MSMSMTSAPTHNNRTPAPRTTVVAAAPAPSKDPSITFAVVCVFLTALMLVTLWLGLTTGLDSIGH